MRFKIVEFQRLNTMGSCKALATVLFEQCILVEDVKLLKLKKKWKVSMPTRKRNERYHEIVSLESAALRDALESEMIRRYGGVQ